jgi:hypothetical protein
MGHRSAYFRRIVTVFPGLLMAAFVAGGRFQPRAFLRYTAAALAMASICLMPWIWRNHRQLGAPIIARSNFELELQLSNNDLASSLEQGALACSVTCHESAD